MDWVLLKTTEKDSLSPFPSHPPPPPVLPPGNLTVENKISPSILLIIVILAVIFFISGLLHLLVRFLFRPPNRETEDLDSVTALQGQLQQLFHLHDAGVDQSFIDNLPVFLYKAIIGLKNPFDCAVCLCEFEADDKLRLLPKCSHAFHLECIDTWLLSHSTCPLCRGSLLPDFDPNSSCSPPLVLVLESGSESSREIAPNAEALVANTSSRRNISTQLGSNGEDEFVSSFTDVSHKPHGLEQKVVPVKLGKFRNVESAVGEEGSSSSNSKVDGRRCFSMGSCEYVLDDSSVLQVAVKPPTRRQSSKKPSLPLMPGHRPAMSESGHSSREEGFKCFDAAKITATNCEIHGDCGIGAAAIAASTKRDSFSVSKIWLQNKKEKSSAVDSSRRAVSFRLPLHHGVEASGSKSKQNSVTLSEIDVSEWESRGSELGQDVDVGSCNSLESQANMPSFARRTLLWLVGRQNKVVHSSSTNHV